MSPAENGRTYCVVGTMIRGSTIKRGNRAGMRRRLQVLGWLSAGLVLLLVQAASAQQSAEESPPPSPPPAQATPSTPGMFESIGRWFDQGAANFRSHMSGAKDRFDDLSGKAASAGKEFQDNAAEVSKGAADATRSAVESVVRLPNARVVRGRQTCPVAPNGAPDCQVAADTLCRAQGFSAGRSLDSTAAEKCTARAWASGRSAYPAECTTETFITRAMCQ